MALGISERLLERVFSPIDLSYAYKKVDAISRQLAAEEMAYKREAQKQYAADLAAMNKEKAGIRSIDTPEITNMYQKWANTQKQLAITPNLISRNPEEYSKLKTEADEAESTLLTMIRGSKELGKREIKDFEDMTNIRNIDFYKDNAADEYRRNVIQRPWSEVVKSNALDKSNYYEDLIDGRKFYENVGRNIESQATSKHKILDTTFKGAPGEVRFVEFEKMPMLGEIQTVVADNLYGTIGPKKMSKFAVQQLDGVMKSGDYENVKQQYNEFFRDDNPNGYKKYFDKPQPNVPLFEGDLTPTQMFVNYTTAKQFLSKLPEGAVGKAYFETPSAGMRYRESIRKVAGEGVEGFVDAYTPMAEYLSQPKAARGASVDRFDETAQGALMATARELTGIRELSNRDVYAKMDKNTGDITILSMKDIDSNGRRLYTKGQKIGTMTGDEINMAASKALGVKGVRAAKSAGTVTPSPKRQALKDPLGLGL